MSIWTRHFRNIAFDEHFLPAGSNEPNSTFDAIAVGSGLNWGSVVAAAGERGKVVVGGGTPTVGLGGHIQGGGHGPLTSKYGLAADNVLQVKVTLPEGRTVVANDYQNTDIFWAIRGVC
jgi:FAD/FMN-containing dehydrogenase